MRFRHEEDAELFTEMVEAWGKRDQRRTVAKEERRKRVRGGRWHRRSHEEAELRKLAGSAANLLRVHRGMLEVA